MSKYYTCVLETIYEHPVSKPIVPKPVNNTLCWEYIFRNKCDHLKTKEPDVKIVTIINEKIHLPYKMR